MGFKIKEIPLPIKFRPASESVKKTAAVIGSIAYGVTAANWHAAMEDPTSATSKSLTLLGENIDRFAPGGIQVGHFLTKFMNLVNDMVFQTVGLNLPRAELINFLDILLLGAPILAISTIGLKNFFKTENLDRLLGKEAVKGSPSHVVIAPNTEILESIVIKGSETGKLKNKKNSEVVGIHLDDGIPTTILPIQKQKGLIGHHFSAQSELFDNPESETSKVLIKDSGIDKASEITFYCLPNIYSSDKDVEFSAEKVGQFLLSLGDDLDGKTINIIMPETETRINGYPESVREQLETIKMQLEINKIEFKLNIFTPERAFERIVEKKVVEFASSRSNGDIQIFHFEQSQEDYYSPEHYAEVLEGHEQIFVSYHNQIRKIIDKLNASKISDSRVVRVQRASISMEDVDYYIRAKLSDKLNKKLENAKLVVVSAFSDQEAVKMAQKLIDDEPDLKRRLLVIVDKNKTAERLTDLEDNLFVETFNPSASVIADFANGRNANFDK